ncbi:MAG: type IV pilus biogenesis/stability protein PilW [Gammaproteobacteria bacterium]|nr:type IV pilus biogenesis/stability protein PilW [Gammaproteobacteria bacterium]
MRIMFRKLFIIGVLSLLVQACVTSNADTPLSENQKAAEINIQLGVRYFGKGEYKLADEKLRRALRQDPKSATANWVFALLQERLGEHEVAEKHFRKAISLDPKDSKAHNNYGTFLCKQDRVLEAEKEFLLAVKNPLYSEASSAYANAGTCFLKVPDKIKAEEYFQKSLGLNALQRSALYQMGLLSFERQEYEQASIYFQKYESVAKHNSRSLWMAYQTEVSLGNQGKADDYAHQLKRSFPASQEARLLAESYWNARSKQQ